MRHRSILVTVLLFISFFASCPSSFADGYYVPELYVKLPNIPVQRALLKYRDGVETLIVESTLDGPGQKFGWIIPVPNFPQRFEKVTPGVLKTLSVSLQPTITHHRPRSRDGAFLRFLFPFLFSAWALAMILKCRSIMRKGCPNFWSIIKFNICLAIIIFVGAPIFIMFVSSFFAVYASSGPLPPPTTVRVESRHLVGDYEISVVTAHKSSDLNNWLGDNGFRSFPDKAIPAVDDYIAKNWAFIAAKIHREGEGTATPHPILIEFKTDRPVYPMRLTALSGSAVNLELFVLAAEEAVPVGYDLEKKYCDYFDYESSYSLYRFRKENIPLYVARAKTSYRSIADTIGHPHAMKLMWSGCVLTKLAGEVSSEQMKEDMFFSLKQAAPYRHHFYSSQWVIERGIIVAIVIGLFGLQGLCFLYKTRERVSPLLLPGLFIVCLAIFSAIYFRFEKVEATSLFKDYDWSSYEMEIYALMTDCLDEIPEPSDEEINTYLSEHQTYTKNILTNQSVVVEDSPGNITLERNGFKRSLILHLPNGTTKILMEFVARIDNVDQLGSLLDILKEDQGGHLRYSIKNKLRVIHDSQAIDLLVTKLKDEDPRIRRNVAWLLGQSKSSSALKPLLVALKDQDEGVRAAAATSLGELRDPQAVEPLIGALKDENGQVRHSVVHGLAKINDPRAVEALIAALQVKSLRSNALYILGNKRDPRAVEPLIALLADNDKHVRERAAETLGQIRDPRAVGPLINLLEDKNGRVREHAVWALGQIRDPRAVGPLINLLEDKNGRVRKRVVWALGHIRDSRAIQPLSAVLLRDSSGHIRADAASALGNIRDRRAVEPLIITLKDEYEMARGYSAIALGKIGDKRAVKHLKAAALNDLEPRVRKEAATALRKIEGPKQKRGPVPRKRARRKSTASAARYIRHDRSYYETKIAELKNVDYRVRNKAVWVLIRSQDPQALEALIASQQHEDPSVRVRVAWALSKKNDLRGLGTLLAAVKDENPEIRSLAAGLLTEIQDPLVIEALVTALQDESQRVRTSAAITLGYHRDLRAVCALIEAVDDSSSQVRWWAIHGLKKMDAEIAAALEDKNSCVHHSILKTLHKTDDLRTAEELITALQDGHELTKAKTSIALSKQRMQAPARRIVPLEHRNNRVRDRTPKSLHKTDDPRTAEELIAALQDESPPVRIRAAIALGDRGDPRAVNPLIAALDDSNSGVRMWAARALERMGPQLVAALENKDPEVRSMAARALRKITHKDFGEDSARWQKWWEKNKESVAHGG